VGEDDRKALSYLQKIYEGLRKALEQTRSAPDRLQAAAELKKEPMDLIGLMDELSSDLVQSYKMI